MEDEHQYKSKTQAKKEAEKLQKLGEELTQLSIPQLKRMGLPDALLTALIDARSITSNVAGRRHRQFIGTLMRDVDPEPIRAALLEIDAGSPVESQIAQEIQDWRDRLFAEDPDSLNAFVQICPELDHQRLRQLLRNIKRDKAAGKPSKSLTTLEQLIVKCCSDQ
jgi:ribosome-associated protein